MRRAALALAGLALALLTGAGGSAQPTAVPDVPGGTATIRGRVVHPERPAAAAGVEVALYALSATGDAGVRRAKSDAEGRFVFENISNDAATTYLVGARFEDVPYPGGRVVFGPGEREHEVEVRIADVTRERREVAVEELRVQLDRSGPRLRVAETRVLRNRGARTVYVPGAQRGGAAPAARARLPEGAEDFAVPFDLEPEGLEHKGRNLAYYGPVYAGDQELAFSYTLPLPAGRIDLALPIPDGAARVVVLAPVDGPPIEVAGLTAGAEMEIGGRRYRRLEGGAHGAGTSLRVALEVPATRSEADLVSLAEARIILDADAAVLDVREEYVLATAGDAPVVAPAGSHLLAVPLPAQARELRFATSAPETALGAAPDGSLAVTGPVPPGESSLEIRYRLPVAEAALVFSRRFAQRVPLLSVYVADTGRLALDSERLHRRRPLRTADRSYAHLEAFEIEAGEEVALRITALAPPSRLPRALSLGVATLLALAAIAVVVAPLRRRDASAQGAAPEALETPAQREREGYLAAIRDLEHDFETGKLSEADHAALRDELRGRALALLRRERETARPPANALVPSGDAPPPAPHCRACRAALRPGDRFCAQCGLPLAEDAEREARA